ncbi:pyruvate dehydrogenase phosphatase regulatory subunit, mitochondrial [Hyalella azteca]|uniref:Pyruvate dehydrogenase phosphatase regulatory subunit, mitochondrial n=1 Tax=Hyalella azteca TaxID=294128 RepID=A0A979FX23_HYAAZ|nr:pyruvate dehydrogenase phosphatase regulatory subunit, mitochondrial [Hyalella azteca]
MHRSRIYSSGVLTNAFNWASKEWLVKSSTVWMQHKRCQARTTSSDHYADKNYIPDMPSSLPSQAQVVVCGAGILGNSIAYHLTREGWRDILVLEKNLIGSGTSQEGSGMLGLFKDTMQRRVITHSIDLIKQLQQDGHDVGFVQCGSLNLARTRDRALALKRRLAAIKPYNIPVEWMDRHDIKVRHPLLETGDLEGAVWCGGDAVVNPHAVCLALAAVAKQQGATFVEGVTVTQVLSEATASCVTPRVRQVNTSHGNVICEYFVNAAGMWAREVGEKTVPRVRVPAFPAEHFYLHTRPMSEATSLPLVRDYDAHTFVVSRGGRFIIGGFEPHAKPAFGRGIPPDWQQLLLADQEHFKPIREAAEHRLPLLQGTEYEKLINAPDTFTPDGLWIMGETSEVDNYFVCCGMNGNSVQGGGIGRAVAEWLVNGSGGASAAMEVMNAFDVKRFVDLHNNRRYLEERTREVVGRHYAIEFPAGQSEFALARRLRCSPIYSEQEALGAVFGARMGFERPLYFDPHHKRGDPPAQMPAGTFRKPAFLDAVREEYIACRECVGLIDLSSFTKIDITSVGDHSEADLDSPQRVVGSGMSHHQEWEEKSSGDEVVGYLQKLCSNDVDVPVGGVVHTGMQNEHGGYENDCLLIRRAANRYLMLAPTIQQTRVMDWLVRQVSPGTNVAVSDITSMFTVLSVVGPKSRDLLTLLSNADLNFFGLMAKEIHLGYASDVLILSFTHMGEPGYTLIIPSEYTLHIYNQILKKDYFVGKFALLRQAHQGVKKRLVHLTLTSHFDPDVDVWPWGGEPIYRDNVHVGHVTSTAFGFTLNKMVCVGFVRHAGGDFVSPDYVTAPDVRYEIDIAGRRFPVHASLQPPKIPIARMDGIATYRPRVRGIVK